MTDARIETFVTLCRLMNYRRTAEELNMTQPAVTQHIHFLEEKYGCKLFLYDKKTLKMTQEAEILKKHAENVLYQEARLRASLHAEGGWSLRVGATKTIGDYVLGKQISTYLAKAENRISVEVDNTKRLLELLSKGVLDFALIEGFFDRQRYESRLYKREEFVGICTKSHPFAGKSLCFEEVRKENLLLREEGSGTRKILEQLLYENNRSVNEFSRVTRVSSFGLITRLLEEGKSITFAYRAVGENHPGLAFFYLKGMRVLREFNYVFLDTPFSARAVDYFDSLRTKAKGSILRAGDL